MPTSAGQLTLIRRRRLELPQFAQRDGPGLMESGSQGALYGFQIGPPAVATLGEKCGSPGDLLPAQFPDCLQQPFFSCPVQPPCCGSTGRSTDLFVDAYQSIAKFPLRVRRN